MADHRVISRLLPLGILAKPAGSRYGLAQRILFLRKESNINCMALRDRDFDDNLSAPKQEAIPWTQKDNERELPIGWTWERKELENYLLDPTVVKKAFGARDKKPPRDYSSILEKAAEKICCYTAARTALSLSRMIPPPLENHWGLKVGGWHLPQELDETACRNGMKQLLDAYPALKPTDGLKLFDQLLEECMPGGKRHQDYLTFFAGKDLLAAMASDLGRQNIEAHTFVQQIVKCIEKTQDDIWDWLPEWSALHKELSALR